MARRPRSSGSKGQRGTSKRTASPMLAVLAENVRRLRAQHRWTQKKLAKRAGISQKTVSRMEDGGYNTRSEQVALVAGAFKVDIRDLFLAHAAPPLKPSGASLLR